MGNRTDPFPGSDWRKAIENAGKPITDEQMPNVLNTIKTQYGLNENQIALLKPMIAAAGWKITPEIYQYINELIAAKQSQDYNSYANQAAMQRAAGINPDLNGVQPGSQETPSGAGIDLGQPTQTNEASSEGACKKMAGEITKTLMQAVSLGLNAYGIIAGQIGTSIAAGTAAAGEDLITLAGNEAGEVTNIDEAINKLVNSRMFRNKSERRAYIAEITRRMNAIDVVTERMKKGTEYNTAKTSLAISKNQATDEYIQNAIDLVNTKQAIDISAAKYDLEIAERNQQFLVDHPEYNETQLKYELSNANLRAAKANATEAESNAKVATNTEQDRINKTKAEARSAESKANTDESNEEVTKLDNENKKTKLKFLKEAYEAVYGTETEEMEAAKGRKDLYSTKQRRKKAKKYLKEYNGKKSHASIGIPGVGNIGFDY